MESLIGKHWHHLNPQEVVELLNTEPDKGLDLLEVEARQEHFGPNALPARTGPRPLVRFLMQFRQPLVYILLVAGGITLLLREFVDAGVIVGVVLVNALVGFLQESKAAKALEALAKTMTTPATVLRASQKTRIASEELVPGDVVLLQSGDKVPADLRLVHVRELQVDESALTGESMPVHKQSDMLPRDTTLAERLNMAYSSSLVTYGQGTGIVVATGANTEVGRISELISTAESLATTLTRKIARFSPVLLYVVLGLAAAPFAVGIWRGEPWIDMFLAAVALAVGAIPEGLPAVITITLAIGVARMAKRRAIIRKLPAVETLGSTTVICSDKTGTLTENQMTVQEIWAGGARFVVSGGGYGPDGRIVPADEQASPRGDNRALAECLRAGLLCNDSAVVQKDGRWTVEGDPTEGALIASAAKFGLTASPSADALPRIDAIPFESQHQFMATLHRAASGQPPVVYLKGAVETVLAKCATTLDADGVSQPLDVERVAKHAEEMASCGLRVLAFARGGLPPGADRLAHADVESGLTFLGLQSMIDPPRPEAIAAIRTCHAAGIDVKMITGDHALTASAIARQIGLDRRGQADRPNPVVLTGRELESLSDAELIETVEESSVFARVTPEQKLRLVRALQARDQVVAMTGDGVNDAPALRQANIGVAMGLGGTEVAKESADMVLTDDNFASIEAAVEEGRGVFDNLTKFIVWTLPTNLGAGLVILAAVFAGATLPILPLQILWINMTTAVCLGLMLAFEPKEPGIMQRRPRDPKTPILTGTLIGRIFLVGGALLVSAFGLFEWALAGGATLAEARTIAVNVFVFVELFYLFNCRSLHHSAFHVALRSNPWIMVGASAMILLQLAFTYSPVMNAWFHSAPIGIWDWCWVLVPSALTFILIEAEKRLRSVFRNCSRAAAQSIFGR